MKIYMRYSIIVCMALVLLGCNEGSFDARKYNGIYFTADKDLVNSDELYVTREGEREPSKLSVFPDVDYLLSVRNFFVSPDKKWIAYTISSLGPISELYIVPTVGGSPIYIAGSIGSAETVSKFMWSPDSKKLAYIKYSAMKGANLFSVNTNGSNNIKISPEITPVSPYQTFSLGVQSFLWSPDANYIAYIFLVESPFQPTLYTVDPNGENAKQISETATAPNGGVYEYAWSPDSQFLSMVASFDGNNDLYVARYDGSQYIQITDISNLEAIQSTHSWAPDSVHIAYLVRNFSGGIDLYSVKRDGSNNSEISTQNPTGDGVSEFYWSPTENRLAYISAYRAALFTAYADGTNNVLISNTSASEGYINYFEWSPKGGYLAYSSFQDTDNLVELYIAKANNTERIKVAGAESIADFGGINDFQWSPNGKSISFRASNFEKSSTTLYVAPLGGGDLTQLSPSLSPGQSVFDYIWSPDSNYVSYRANWEINNMILLYRSSINGQNNEKISGKNFLGESVRLFQYVN